MAENTANPSQTATRRRWASQIAQAKDRYKLFWADGDTTVAQYRLEKAQTGQNVLDKRDQFNILFSTTETIRPNLFAQTPRVRVKLRNREFASPRARAGAAVLEGCLSYLTDEGDLEQVVDNNVEDFLLPGLAQSWVNYEPSFKDAIDPETKEPVLDENGEPVQELLDEKVSFEYLYWKDFLTGYTRVWKNVPWVAKRVWLTKERAVKRFGKKKAELLDYGVKQEVKEDGVKSTDVDGTAEVWEIWCKTSNKVYWHSDEYKGADVIDERDPPLKLKNFFPCPRPLRAISNTKTFVPKSLYSQYKGQCDTINQLTKRIRYLTDALRVVGLYNGSETKLADLLNPSQGNRMIAVESWAAFAQAGGIKGNIEWLPLDQIVTTILQLQQARETAKAEVYEITGFSDILRGVSKASETLGAQQIKDNWAGARVRKLQKEVQRFVRDLIAIAGEVISENCDIATIAEFSAYEIPTPEEVQTNPEMQQRLQLFKEAVDFIKQESRRVASINIETDSTILADEQADQKSRMDFLGAAGAFLQQAVPAMEKSPELGPLLGQMLLFTIRTFPASRDIEDKFEQVQQLIANKPPADPSKSADAMKANAARETAQMTAQTEQSRISAEMQKAQMEIEAKAEIEREKLAAEREAEVNRHAERVLELQIEQDKLRMEQDKLELEREMLSLKRRELDEKIELEYSKLRKEIEAMAAKPGAEGDLNPLDTGQGAGLGGDND